MAWKPWYDRVAEMDSAQEREEFIKGVFGTPSPVSGKKLAGMAAMTLIVGAWAVKKPKRRR